MNITEQYKNKAEQSPDISDVVKRLINPDLREKHVNDITHLYGQAEHGMLPADFDIAVRNGLENISNKYAENPQTDLENDFDRFVDELTGLAALNSYHGITPVTDAFKQAIVEVVTEQEKE